MRYWAYFAAKIAAAGGVMYGLLLALNHFWPLPPKFLTYSPPRFLYDLPFTTAVLVWFLLGCGLLYLCWWDQRLRCRVCLRRLRMPVETGSWGYMLQLGRPQIEYICPYGHGNLKVAEVQISGLENPEWTPKAEMWEELAASGRDSDDRR